MYKPPVESIVTHKQGGRDRGEQGRTERSKDTREEPEVQRSNKVVRGRGFRVSLA